MNTLTHLPLSTDQADAAVQDTIFADLVEDYEFDLTTFTHRYFLSDGTVLILRRLSDLPLTVDQADQLVMTFALDSLVEDYEFDLENDCHLYFLVDGSTFAVDSCGISRLIPQEATL